MKVEFRKSFEKDLGKIRDGDLLAKIKAQISTDGTHQIVILPEDFKMVGTEVYIKKVGNAIVLIAKDNPWQSWFESLEQFTDDFMTTRD